MKVQLILWRTIESSLARIEIEFVAPKILATTHHSEVLEPQTHDSGEPRRGLGRATSNCAQDFRDCHCPRSEEDLLLATCNALFD